MNFLGADSQVERTITETNNYTAIRDLKEQWRASHQLWGDYLELEFKESILEEIMPLMCPEVRWQ